MKDSIEIILKKEIKRYHHKLEQVLVHSLMHHLLRIIEILRIVRAIRIVEIIVEIMLINLILTHFLIQDHHMRLTIRIT